MTDSKKIENNIAKITFKFNTAIFLNYFCIIFSIAVLIFSSILLIRKNINLNYIFYIIIAVSFVITSIILSYIFYRKQSIKKETITAILDKETKANGLLLTSLESNVEDWENLIKNIKLPVYKIKIGKDIIKIIGSVIILIICYIFPLPKNTINSNNNKIDLTHLTDEIEDKIENLKENNIITEKETEEIQKNIEEIKEQTDADDPAKTYDSLSSLEDSIENKMEERINEFISADELMEEIEISMNKDFEESTKQTQEELDEKMKNLEDFLNENPEFKELMDQISDNNLSKMLESKDMENLNKTIQEAQKELSEMIKKAIEEGTLSLENIELAKLLTEEQLKELQEKGLIEGNLENYLSMLQEGGKEGGGHLDILFNNEEKSILSDKKELLNSEVIDIEKTESLGKTKEKPEIEIIDDGKGGVLGLKIKEGGSARHIYIAPHQRKAIEKYFKETN